MPTIYNSTVKILTDVPLSPNYTDTILFDTAEEQYAYFNTKVKQVSRDNEGEIVENGYVTNLIDQSYSRDTRGYLRVQYAKFLIHDCNYLMFKNYNYPSGSTTRKEDFWYYAFITNVKYINENTSEIEFVIDVMQTFMFRYDFEECFISRQHTVSDNMFEHILAEDLDLGDQYVINTDGSPSTPPAHTFYSLKPNLIAIIANYKLQHEDEISNYALQEPTVAYSKSSMITGNFCPCSLITIEINNESQDPANPDYTKTRADLSYILSRVEGSTEIICMYLCRKEFGTAETVAPYIESASGDFKNIMNFRSINGYVPKNKKLFCYPFNCLEINNMCGNVSYYKFENWNSLNDIATFRILGSNFTVPTVAFVPKNYLKREYCMEEMIAVSNFPQCAWESDAFKAYFAQHLYQDSLNLAHDVSQLLAPPKSSGFGDLMGIGGYIGIISAATKVANENVDKTRTIAQDISMRMDLERAPHTTFGNAKFNNLLTATGYLGFELNQKCIRYEYAKAIDEYFHMFGYRVNTVRKPNIKARQGWTYIQTRGCQIRGTLDVNNQFTSPPASYMRIIESIYDKGIRFWNIKSNGVLDDSLVGVYRLNNNTLRDNPPLTQSTNSSNNQESANSSNNQESANSSNNQEVVISGES